MLWCSDFETTNSENDCRVWSWKSITLDETQEASGLDIESFLTWLCKRGRGDVVYFHNLKFDGEFIIYHLLKTGWVLQKGDAKLYKKTFKTLISDMGQWYQISLRLPNGNLVTIKDSLKIWNFSIRQLAKTMHMSISKGDIDYNAFRHKGYEPTPEEWDYIDRDVRIACRAMDFMMKQGYTKLTAGANALFDYKMIVGKNFEYYFPHLDDDIDEFIRHSYRGGWCYANPLFQEREIGEGITLDVNSLYPSRMYYEDLPYGTPLYYTGRYKENEKYPLYVQHVFIDLTLKKDHLPTFQLKKSLRFGSTEYIKSTHGEPAEAWLTSVDLELIKEHYDIHSIEYIDGYKFKASKELFRKYVDKWMDIKEQATLDGDIPRRNQAKLFMNSLYGKFAKRPVGRSKYPYIGEDDRLHLELGEEEDRGSLYIPVGTFITAYARAYTIRSAQKNYDRFLYADTDSLHLIGTEIPAELEVHETHLGAWKHESTFLRAYYIGAKCYCEEEIVSRETLEKFSSENPTLVNLIDWGRVTLLKITAAGLPEKAKSEVTFDNFRVGLTVSNKLLPKHVPGGVVLKETTFQILKR